MASEMPPARKEENAGAERRGKYMRVQLKRIICATDLSEFSNHTIPYGVALAKEFGARLYVCHVIDLPSVGVYGEAYQNSIEQQNRILRETESRLRGYIGEQPVKWEPLITRGHTSDEIARLAEEKNADLVIAASHGRSGFKRLVLGSVTERLMRTLACPLLILRSPETDSRPGMEQKFELKRILIGCDFSPDSTLAFEHGLSLAQEFESELHLANVIEPPVSRTFLRSTSENLEPHSKEVHSRLHEKLKSLVPDEAKNWCIPKTVVLEGQPHEALTQYAKLNDINLVVLGVRGYGLLESLFVGSTTDRVMRNADFPLMAVRPKG
jgi:nucleotide-binding universal stress UspA family protein